MKVCQYPRFRHWTGRAARLLIHTKSNCCSRRVTCKGYGLTLIFECLSSLMLGNPLLTTAIRGENPLRLDTQNSFLGAIDIG